MLQGRCHQWSGGDQTTGGLAGPLDSMHPLNEPLAAKLSGQSGILATRFFQSSPRSSAQIRIRVSTTSQRRRSRRSEVLREALRGSCRPQQRTRRVRLASSACHGSRESGIVLPPDARPTDHRDDPIGLLEPSENRLRGSRRGVASTMILFRSLSA